MYTNKMVTVDITEKIESKMDKFLKRLSSKEEVVGVVLLGGLSKKKGRNYLDKYSDIDVTFFLNIPEAQGYTNSKEFCAKNQDTLPDWLPEFQFFIDINNQLMEVNCHQLIYQIESNDNLKWNEFKKEAYLYTSEVVYDKGSMIKKLFYNKCKLDEKENNNKLITIMSQIPWYGWINPVKQFERGFSRNSHMLINQSVELIIESIFIINKRYRPHMKWRLDMASELKWTPNSLVEKIEKILLVNEFTKEDIVRRCSLVNELYNEIKIEYKKLTNLDVDPFYYASVYIDTERQLREVTSADNIVGYEEGNETVIKEKGLINYFLIDNYDIKNKQDLIEKLQKNYNESR